MNMKNVETQKEHKERRAAMEKGQELITFEIKIEQCSNSSWQGTLTAEGKVMEFQSELELLLEMNRLISREDNPQDMWKNN